MSGHHVIPLKALLGAGAALMVLTFLTIAVTWIQIPEPFNVIVAIGIAVVKATVVCAIFMALYWDAKFNTLVFLSSILFLVIFIVITLLDTLFREVPFSIY